jgi:hypothetical protein
VIACAGGLGVDFVAEIVELVAEIAEAFPWDLTQLEGVEGCAGAGREGRRGRHDVISLVGSVEDLILLRRGNAVTAGFVGEPFAEEVAALFEVRRSLVKHDGSFDDLLLGRVEFADFFSLAHRSLEVIDDGVAGVIEETGECGSEHGTGNIADSW